MSTRYVVEIDLRTVGNLPRDVDRATVGAGKLNQAVERVGRGLGTIGANVSAKLVGAMDAVVARAWDFTKLGVTAGGAALFAGAVYGVTKLNAELETSKISLGAIFKAHGIVGDVPAGITMAADTIAKMRIDAAKLPGEFEDLQRIFTTAAVPAFQSGMDPDTWRQVASQVMATAKAVSMPMDQAAREFAMLLEGRSGAHNVFGMRLLGLSGDKAEAFNKTDAPERLKIIRAELAKYGEAIDAFGKSFDGVSSTFKDSAKEFIRMATEPLFKRVTGTLGDLNKWFDDNKNLISIWADRAGEKLVAAFEWAKAKIKEWGPVVREFATNAWARLKDIWKDIAPHVERASEALKEFMKDPKAIDKLITAGKIYLAIKAGQSGLGMAAGAGQTVGGLAQLATLFGAGGGVGVLGSLTAAIEKLAVVTVGGAGKAGGGLMALGGGSAVGALAPLAAGLAGTAAQFQLFKLAQEGATHAVEAYKRETWNAQNEVRRFMDTLGPLEEESISINAKFGELRAAGDDLTAGLLEAALAAREFAEDARRIDKDRGKVSKEIGDDALDAATKGQAGFVKGELAKAEAKASKAKHGGGGGGTKIQKVEIVVTSNQHPSRIARAVFNELSGLDRNRGSSPYVRNFSASQP